MNSDLIAQPSSERFNLMMGINEVPYLGEGWMEREVSSDGQTYRATEPTATLIFPAGGRAVVSALICAPPACPDAPFIGEFVVLHSDNESDARITPFALHFPYWSLREFELPATEHTRRIVITVNHAWHPADLFQNHDRRTMGILVSSFSISKCEMGLNEPIRLIPIDVPKPMGVP